MHPLSLKERGRLRGLMYGKTHSEDTRVKMSERKNKYLLGVGIFDLALRRRLVVVWAA